jgi:hypothetical protein
MKPWLVAALAAPALLCAPAVFAYSQSCVVKINSLRAQISAAQQAGNAGSAGKVSSLQSTLTKTKAKCTQEARQSLAARKVLNGQKEVRKAQDELSQADEELRSVQATGDVKNIGHAKKEVAERQEKLREKANELRNAQANQERLKG